jgi:hypothetical protein
VAQVELRLFDKRQELADPGVPTRKINFLGVVPESRSSSRSTDDMPVPPSSGDSGGGGVARGELRLRVLRSLPSTHQQYLFKEIRILCRYHLRKWQIPAAEVTPEELLSEIWRKLLGTVSLDNEQAEKLTALSGEWSINLDAPERDGRVVWLIQEIGGSNAIAHRLEDISRQRHGRFQPDRGRPIVQLSGEDDVTETGTDPEEPNALHHVDAQRIWHGLLITANLKFKAHDDVLMLLRVMDDVRDVLEEPSGQWPIKRMVDLLNKRFPPSSWTDDRVDNAKRRLVNWIKRLMQTNGFDTTDLEDLFARVARNQEKGERVLLPGLDPRKVN